MKKLLTILAAVGLIAGLASGCKQENKPPAAPEAPKVDTSGMEKAAADAQKKAEDAAKDASKKADAAAKDASGAVNKLLGK